MKKAFKYLVVIFAISLILALLFIGGLMGDRTHPRAGNDLKHEHLEKKSSNDMIK